MKYDGILFDLDGTLWNATQAIAVSWGMALQGEPDIPTVPTVKELEGVMGMTSDVLMATLFPHISYERGQELFEKCCVTELEYLNKHGAILYEGIEDMLRTLSQKLPLFIVSNCNDGYIESFLDSHKMRPYIKDWECIGRTGKQKWENIQLVIERNHIKSPVYVGDTSMDMDAAQKAGVPFIHAAYGFGIVPGAEKLLSPMDLPNLI